jgi:chaperonin cofactor prefoldin
MLLVKVLGIDIHQSELERRQRRLTQRLAILEEENRQNTKQIKTLQQQLQSTNEN